jgi:hypothetical protein
LKKVKNRGEKRLYNQLKRSKVKFDYESEKIPYVFSGHYVCDFPTVSLSGNKLYIEYKGYLRPEDKRKLVAVKKCHPAMDLRIVFKNKSYIKWCDKHKIPWAIEKVPKEWLK